MFQSNVGIYKQPVRGMNAFLGTVHWVLFDFLLWVLRASVAKAFHTHRPVAMGLLWACFGISCRRKSSKWIKWQLNEGSVARKHAPVFCLAASQLPAATMFWSHHWPLRNSNFDQSSSDLAASILVYCCHNPESPGSSAGPVAWCPGDPNQQFQIPLWWSELNCHGKRGKNDKMSKAVEISCVHFYRKWEIRYNWMDRLTELDGLKERWRIISYGTRGLIHFMGAGAGRPH